MHLNKASVGPLPTLPHPKKIYRSHALTRSFLLICYVLLGSDSDMMQSTSYRRAHRRFCPDNCSCELIGASVLLHWSSWMSSWCGHPFFFLWWCLGSRFTNGLVPSKFYSDHAKKLKGARSSLFRQSSTCSWSWAQQKNLIRVAICSGQNPNLNRMAGRL